MPDAEILLVGAAASFAAGERSSVVARAGPDVVVLRADLGELPQLAHGARLAMGRSADGIVHTIGDEKALDALDAGARLFAEAWRDKPLHKSARPGEGLSWDAPGFQPPGPPTPRNR